MLKIDATQFKINKTVPTPESENKHKHNQVKMSYKIKFVVN